MDFDMEKTLLSLTDVDSKRMMLKLLKKKERARTKKSKAVKRTKKIPEKVYRYQADVNSIASESEQEEEATDEDGDEDYICNIASSDSSTESDYSDTISEEISRDELSGLNQEKHFENQSDHQEHLGTANANKNISDFSRLDIANVLRDMQSSLSQLSKSTVQLEQEVSSLSDCPPIQSGSFPKRRKIDSSLPIGDEIYFELNESKIRIPIATKDDVEKLNEMLENSPTYYNEIVSFLKNKLKPV